MLRDVIEHIPNQERFMHYLKDFMHGESIVFFGFPVWCNPFGGHQQICSNKLLAHMPWLHLFPNALYKKVLHWGKEKPGTIKGLLEIKATGISLHRFEKILSKEQYQVLCHTHYLINPNYEIKFGLRPRIVPKLLQIPYLQDFYTTAMYYVVKKHWNNLLSFIFFPSVQIPHNHHIINLSSHKIMYISPALLTDSNIFTTFALKISNHAKYLFVHSIG